MHSAFARYESTLPHTHAQDSLVSQPVAKLPKDRQAVLKAAVSGNKKFFFGSDSAPHPVVAKLLEVDLLNTKFFFGLRFNAWSVVSQAPK